MDCAVLKAVVAYVEVRSGSDNRSAAIAQELKQLGARVEPTFTDTVTHVVFKEGMKRTWNKAMKRKVHLVSVSWIDSCKQNQMQVSEKDFSAVRPEEIFSPLPRFNQAVRWKKMKSMQPCDFDEELARSAERGEKRRKRIMMANRFTLNEEFTPTTSPMPVLAFETQPRSPLLTALSRVNSPVPDTPPSMQERLEKMRREQRQVLGTTLDDSPPATPKVPIDKQLQRRLFDMCAVDFVSTESSSEEGEVASSKIADLIHSLDSSSERGSQSSTGRKGVKLLTLDKSPRNFTVVKSPGQQTCSKFAPSASPLKNHTDKIADINKESSVSSNKTEVFMADKRSSSPNVSAPTVGRCNKMKSSQTSENKRRSVPAGGKLYNKKKRMSLISNALSPKDTNIEDPSLTVKSAEIEQHFGKRFPESNQKLINCNVPCKLGAKMEENMPEKCDSAKILKCLNVKDMENETCMIGTELKQRRSRRLSKCPLNSEVMTGLNPSSNFGSKSKVLLCSTSVSSAACDETGGKTDIAISNVVEKPAAALDDVSQEVTSTASLKPKTTRKKRNLFSEAALPSLLCSAETSDRQNCPSEVLSAHKKQTHILGSNTKSDISFMFGASKSLKTKEKQVKSRHKEQNTESKKTSVLDLSGLHTCEVSCSPKVTHTTRKSLCKTALENTSARIGQQNNSLRDSVLRSDLSMSIAYGNDTSVSNIRAGNSRRSLDEFQTSSRISGKITKLKKISTSALTAIHETAAKPTACISNQKIDAVKGKNRRTDGIDQPVKQRKRKRRLSSRNSPNGDDEKFAKRSKGKSMSSCFDDDTTVSESSPSLQDTPVRLRHAHSLIMEQRFQPHLKRSAYSLVVTSLHSDEQETVYSIVKNLGVFHMTNNVEATSSHVVCGEPRRTLNVLRAIASGCWLLRKEWVLESLEAGNWLQEESYEITDFPAAIKSRTERQKVGPAYKVDIFSKLGPIFVSATCTPPRKEMVHLINLCSGHITGSETRAAIHLGDDHNPTKLVIKPAWVLDCIMKLELLPTDGYIVFPRTSNLQRESSPEF